MVVYVKVSLKKESFEIIFVLKKFLQYSENELYLS